MKRELSTLLGLLLSVAVFAQMERNVKVTLSVDSFINSHEQTAYLYGYIGNECGIYDSVKIVPGKQTYRLKGYAPYENTLYLALSRRGPFTTCFLAHPSDRVELQLTKDDGERPGTLYKKLQKGSSENNELVTLWMKINDVANRRIQIKDSMAIIGLPEEKIERLGSWCRLCIQAMPNIIQAQRMFKDDFVCCAVTIDKSESLWQESIKTFSLQELQHFKGTDDEGQILPEIDRLIPDRTIPRNYLLNREGKIIATDIYDEALISKLKRIIKKRPNDFPLYEND